MKKLLFLLALPSLLLNCSVESEDNAASSNFASATLIQLAAVSENFVPASMASSTSSKSNQSIQSSNPCEGTDLFGCQPRLVKLYISLAKEFFDMSREMLSGVASGIGDLADGATGTHNTDDGYVVTYSKTSSTDYDVLISISDNIAFDIDVNGSTSTIKVNLANMPEEGGESRVGLFEISITYTDENNWSTTSFMYGMACQANDVRAPERMKIKITNTDSIWTGKSMLYNGVWATFGSEPTCDTTAADNTSMNLYTDFVANATAAKAKVYMAKRDASDFVSNIDGYALSTMCNSYYTNFGYGNAEACNTALSSAESNLPVDDYPNPFCTTAPTNATWENDCTGTDATIAAASFGSSDDWSAPTAYYQETITMRTSLSK